MICNPQNFILKPGLNSQTTKNPTFGSTLALLKPHPFHSSPSPPLMALFLYRPKNRSLTNPSLIHLTSCFSTSTSAAPSNDPSDSQSQQQQQSSSSFSSYLSDVKASLKQQQQQQNPQNNSNLPPLRRPTFPNPPNDQSVSKLTTNTASFDETKKKLAEFRSRSSLPPSTAPPNSAAPSRSSATQQISFSELYKRNILAKSEGGGGSGTNQSGLNSGINTATSQPISGKPSYDAIRECLRQIRHSRRNNNTANADTRGSGGGEMSFPSLKLKPGNENESTIKSTIIGGTDGLPEAVFGKEMKEEQAEEGETSTEFVKIYSYDELGTKLQSLRPQVKKGDKGWFSLEEMNERLRKLREMEKKEAESMIGGVSYKDLREGLVRLKMTNDEKDKKSPLEGLNLLGKLGSGNVMLQLPKEHLVEKYFHPDNMSSSEKMKVELAKVRDEFKMSESDCGSARVQAAQLTTKIKHLSSVLHKKDKHSRKGLIAMVQKRKKLLKYLRRTDWDSHCFVLSKLGLRDNPDYKH